jgi:hypothetical protein
MVDNYRLDDLGWYQFERLCQALLRAKYGANLEAWGGSRDFGRDAYSSGQLRYPDPKHLSDGPFVFQVKFIANANLPGAKLHSLIFSAVTSENKRISDRLASGLWENPRHYTLLTNAPLSATLRADLTKLIKQVLPNAEIKLHGATDIAALLDDSPGIRISYPQILGLRDLSNLLAATVSADVVSRSTISLNMASQLSQIFVATEAYNKALKILDSYGFVVLTGPPEMGKTATAWMIAIARFTNNWEVYDSRSPAEVFRAYKVDRNQVFVADDAFGSTEYRPEIASEWAAQLDRLIAMCGQKHWLIWTSRPGPLKKGLERLHFQGVSTSFPDPMRIQVDASKLSVAEKSQILYRHAKSADLSSEAIDLIRNNAIAIVQSRHFTPLRIKRLISEQLPQVMSADPSQRRDELKKAVHEGLQQPSSAMRTSFAVLPEGTRALLIAMLNGSNRPLRLYELDAYRRAFLQDVPLESIERAAGLVDDHFLKVEELGVWR